MARIQYPYEVWMKCVKEDPWRFISVPLEHRTLEMSLLVISTYPTFINHVPKEHRTPELCEIAVNGRCSLEHIPEELKTLELCMKTLNPLDGINFKYFPVEFKIYELCLSVVSTYLYVLGYIPVEHRTHELCLAAISKRGFSLFDIPDEFKTPEICMSAIEEDCCELRFVPEEMKTYELCLTAVTNTGGGEDDDLLTFVPDRYKTFELCYQAVSHCIFAFDYVPEEHMTRKMYSLLFEPSGCDYEYGSYSSQDNPHEMCMAAVLHDGLNLRNVPYELQTEEVIVAAIANDVDATEHVLNPFAIRDHIELLAFYIERL